ncbi:SDR family oxidoreductase [Pontibacter flavimaris]|uniref:NAD(P)-dependent oxidoreductase n=1 Tax=Pontibacter flavimaris TaxID=1797110 RepID=A0A1Q5PH26_9BACT|nr:SDR family oxidoreductase [Pontibacter flavimaris]OKL41493.1 NAD(P)-dependent oxidoreductase [Pontibacter flavimaris]
MEDKRTISIMGCGWLGMPLAERLLQQGYSVKGSTTTPEKIEVLLEKDIQPYLLDLGSDLLDKPALEDFLDTDVLVLNIPPHLRSDGGEAYMSQMQLLLRFLLDSPVSRILFVSSTSVYQDLNRVVTEEDISFTEELEPKNMLLQAEQLIQDREDWVTTIVRFAGLVGGNRQPGRWLAGKKNVPDGDAPVNLIHRDDCVNILYRIIEQERWGKVYNACADEHPRRRDFYTSTSVALGLAPPEFQDMTETRFKLINSQKLKDELSYTFVHPEPMAFFS